MKKILIGVLLSLSLVGCGINDTSVYLAYALSEEGFNEYIEQVVTENENICTLYNYGNIEKEEYEKHFKDQINYINEVLEKADDLNADTVDFATEYTNYCNTLLHCGQSQRYILVDEMEELYDEYVKEEDVTEKDLPEKREGWDYTVEGLESASSCEQMEGYINYSLRDGRKDEDDIKILNWKIDQVDIVLAENEVEENLLNYFKAYRECCVNLLSAERDVEYQGEISKLRMAEMFKNN